MRIKNKKGIGLEWYLLIGAFFLGFVAYFTGSFGPHKVIGNYLGQYQFSIIKSSNEAEKALFYIDESAKYSLQQAVYELGKNGGISEIETEENEVLSDNKCGKFYGYTLWRIPDNAQYTCIDENKIKSSLEYMFKKNLNEYILNYPDNILVDNYNYEIKGSLEIAGKAIEPLKFDILKDEKKEVVRQATGVKLPELEGNFVDFTGTGLCSKGSRCILTEEAFSRLEKAQKRANEKGVSLDVYSALRTKEEQQALWDGKTPERYAQRFPDIKERAKWVCNPSEGEKSCPHMTGKVLDVRLKGKTAKTMTSQDWVLLYKIMTDDKPDDRWVKYAKEPWHFECCGTIRYAKATEKGVTEIV